MHSFFDGLTYNSRGYCATNAIFEKGSHKKNARGLYYA